MTSNINTINNLPQAFFFFGKRTISLRWKNWQLFPKKKTVSHYILFLTLHLMLMTCTFSDGYLIVDLIKKKIQKESSLKH